MMDGLRIIGLIAFACLILPWSGWWLAARLRDEPLVRFTAACLAGCCTCAGAELLAYVFGVPQWVALGMVCAACAVSAAPLRAAILRREFAWDALLIWGGISAILAAATVRYAVQGFPGALWDWYEHWLRAVVYYQRAAPLPERAYILAGRGPLLNAAAALLFNFGGSAHYWVFQVLATTLNTLAFLPFALFLRSLAGLSRRAALLLGAGMMTITWYCFIENTFTWTKHLTAAFILFALHEYLMAYRAADRVGMARALAYLAPAFLCHYLALVYAVLLGLHLLVTAPLREFPGRAVMRSALIWYLLIVPWFGFMAVHLGIGMTLRSNTTLGNFYAEKDAGGNLIPLYRILPANLCMDLLWKGACAGLRPPDKPCIWMRVDAANGKQQQVEHPCSQLMTMTGVAFAFRYTGMLAILLAAAASAKRWAPGWRGKWGRDYRFVAWVLGVGLLLNLLPVRWNDPNGTNGENLQSWLLLLAAITIAGLVRLPRAALVVLGLAFAIEHARADWELIRIQSIVLPFSHHSTAMAGHPPIGIFGPWPPSEGPFFAPATYVRNYEWKVMGEAVFFRDMHPEDFNWFSWVFLAIGCAAVVAGAWKARPGPGHL
jgi:hypothetical protein